MGSAAHGGCGFHYRSVRRDERTPAVNAEDLSHAVVGLGCSRLCGGGGTEIGDKAKHKRRYRTLLMA